MHVWSVHVWSVRETKNMAANIPTSKGVNVLCPCLIITCMMIRSLGKPMACDCTNWLEASFTALSGKLITGAT